MYKKMLLIATLSVALSGCFMSLLALVGPATSGFSTASIIQAGFSSGASYMLQKSTGKTLSEHAFEVLSKDILQHTYLPKGKNQLIVAP